MEYQCSPISKEQLGTRTIGYKDERITPIWIYGGVPYQKQINSHTFELSDFHFSLAEYRASNNLSILSYSPKTKRMYLLHGIIPLTTRKVHATLYSHRLFTSTIPVQLSIIPKKLNLIKWGHEKISGFQQRYVLAILHVNHLSNLCTEQMKTHLCCQSYVGSLVNGWNPFTLIL
ncbi:competence protein CoiA family protein [Bacillus sp. N9]